MLRSRNGEEGTNRGDILKGQTTELADERDKEGEADKYNSEISLMHDCSTLSSGLIWVIKGHPTYQELLSTCPMGPKEMKQR